VRVVVAVGEREQFSAADLLALPGALLRIRSWYAPDRGC